MGQTPSIPDDYTMPFGKYEGKAIANVPASYLLWLYEGSSRGVFGAVKQYIEENIEKRRELNPTPVPGVSRSRAYASSLSRYWGGYPGS